VFEPGKGTATVSALRDIRHAIASSRASVPQGFRNVPGKAADPS
jgi:hypothetical protein